MTEKDATGAGPDARRRKMQYRTARILETALELFCESSLEDTSMEMIAKRSGVGAATVYRYFDTKAELAIQCGITYWEKISEKYLSYLGYQEYLQACGYEQMALIMQIFNRIFEKEFRFLKFLQEFDVFVQKYQISNERLAEYEACILNLKPYVTNALERGLQDKSLAFSYSVEEVYFSMTHAMLSLMQKLSSNGKILTSDERVSLAVQVKITGELLLGGLKAAGRI